MVYFLLEHVARDTDLLSFQYWLSQLIAYNMANLCILLLQVFNNPTKIERGIHFMPCCVKPWWPCHRTRMFFTNFERCYGSVLFSRWKCGLDGRTMDRYLCQVIAYYVVAAVVNVQEAQPPLSMLTMLSVIIRQVDHRHCR